MKWAVYYLILVANLVLSWRAVTDATVPWRIVWILTGLSVVALPFFVPEKLAFYYGLIGNVTLHFWSADTFMGKGIRRLRSVVGGVLLLPLPMLFPQIYASWPASLLVPTLGHLVVSGASWPIVVRVLAKVSDENP